MVDNQVNDRLDTIIAILENGGGGGGVSVEQREYVQCGVSGIITDIKFNSSICVEVKFVDETYNNNTSIFGSSTSGTPHLTLYSNKYYSGNNGSEWNFGTWSSGEHTFIYSDENNDCLFDGEIVKSEVDQSSANIPLTLGCRGSVGSNVYRGKLKYIKVYDKSNDMELIHDIEPLVAYVNVGESRVNIIEALCDLKTGKIYNNANWTISEV